VDNPSKSAAFLCHCCGFRLSGKSGSYFLYCPGQAKANFYTACDRRNAKHSKYSNKQGKRLAQSISKHATNSHLVFRVFLILRVSRFSIFSHVRIGVQGSSSLDDSALEPVNHCQIAKPNVAARQAKSPLLPAIGSPSFSPPVKYHIRSGCNRAML
jgi:hypothetical protein